MNERFTAEEAREADELLHSLFVESLGLEPFARDGFLRERCAGDSRLESEIRRLIRAHEESPSFLERSIPTRLHAADAESQVNGSGERSEFGAALKLARALHRLRGSESASSEEATLTSGDVIGSYRIVRFHSKGGMGEVYQATHVSLSDPGFAVKVCRSGSMNAKERERFRAEATLASSLHHPSIVQVIELGEDTTRGLSFIVMRFVSGPTLQDLLQQFVSSGRCLAEDDRRRVVGCCAEIAEALGVLHQRGLIHRDVKPGNIVLEEQGPRLHPRAVLVDFGLARPLPAGGRLTTLWISPPYTAPEVLAKRVADARSDVFSLGMTMHDLLACRSAEDRQARSPIDDSVEPLCDLVPGIDRDLDAIVSKACETDPAFRYADGAALAIELRHWLLGEPVRARRARPWERLQKSCKKNAWSLLRVAAGVILLVAGGFLLVASIRTGARSVAKARNIRVAWEQGDLEALRRVIRTEFPLRDGIWLSSELIDLRDEMEERQAAAPIVSVLAEMERGGVDAAFRRACAFVQRDGLGIHAVLDRFLAREFLDPDRNQTFNSSRLEMLSRLMFENGERIGRTAAAEPFRHIFLGGLRAEEEWRIRAHLLCALGGCGEIEDLEEMVELLLQRARRHEAIEIEELRVGIANAEQILRRAQRTGGLQALGPERLSRVTARILEIVEIVRTGATVAEALLVTSAEEWLCSDAFARRAFDWPEEHQRIADSETARLRLVLAARLDPDLREQMSRVLKDLILGSLGDRCTGYFIYGQLAGAFADESLIARSRREVEEFAKADTAIAAGELLTAETALAQFDRGVADLRERVRGEGSVRVPDRDTWLSRELESPPTECAVEGRRSEQGEPGRLGTWDFTQSPADFRGAAKDAFACAATLIEDEFWSTSRAIRLGCSPHSFLRLAFEQFPAHIVNQQIVIECQKAGRACLPESGHCELTLLLDGKAVVENYPVQEGSARVKILLPMEAFDKPLDRTILLRLPPSSDTCLRINRIWIEEKKD